MGVSAPFGLGFLRVLYLCVLFSMRVSALTTGTSFYEGLRFQVLGPSGCR